VARSATSSTGHEAEARTSPTAWKAVSVCSPPAAAPHLGGVLHQPFLLEDLQVPEADRTAGGVAGVRVGVHPAIRVGTACMASRISCDTISAEGQVAAGDPLGERQDVGWTPSASGEPVPVRRTGDDLVRDEQDLVLGADLADQGK